MPIYPEALGLIGPGELELNPYFKPVELSLTSESFRESSSAVPPSFVGRAVSKCLERHGPCRGTVTRLGIWFEVRYEDGDEEELTREEHHRLLDLICRSVGLRRCLRRQHGWPFGGVRWHGHKASLITACRISFITGLAKPTYTTST